jgi:hypothetical protein
MGSNLYGQIHQHSCTDVEYDPPDPKLILRDLQPDWSVLYYC